MKERGGGGERERERCINYKKWKNKHDVNYLYPN